MTAADLPEEDLQCEAGQSEKRSPRVHFLWNSANARHPATLELEELIRQCRITQTRRGGPGGQHRNKTSTAIVIEHLSTGIRGEAGERRSQAENRSVAIRRLREALAIQVRSSRLSATGSEASSVATEPLREKYSGMRLAISPTNWDFPGVLALILDDIQSHEGRVKEVAELWGTSTSQLVRLLKLHAPAFLACNAMRESHGLSQLR